VPDDELEPTGIAAADLSEDDLLRELEQLHRTRNETLLHAPTQALQHHSERTAELELEYLRRHPERQVDESRLRHQAREHTS
jgi:DNA-directed RNA polymerase specialized sigma54-like protein